MNRLTKGYIKRMDDIETAVTDLRKLLENGDVSQARYAIMRAQVGLRTIDNWLAAAEGAAE